MKKDIKRRNGKSLSFYTGIDDRVYMHCGGCEHVADVKAAFFLARFGDLTDWLPIKEKMVCKKCGYRGGHFNAHKIGGYKEPRPQANE